MEILHKDIREAKDNQDVIIAHIVNDKGGWGAGVSGVISDMYPVAEKFYRSWSANVTVIPSVLPPFKLGQVQLIPVNQTTNTIVANLLAQKGYKSDKNKKPFQLNNFIEAFTKLCTFAKSKGMSIHMPKVGSGLGGGDWDEISTIIDNISNAYGVKTYIYAID